jgi:hypothetical protein
MRYTARRAACLAAIAAALLASCSDEPEGIYYSLAHEQPINRDASKVLAGSTPSGIARFGDAYYLAAGAIYKRGLTRAKDAWAAMTMPSGASLCVDLAPSTTRLYAAFQDQAAANLGLYAWDGSAWTAVSPASLGLSSMRIVALIDSGTEVFVSTSETIGSGDSVETRLRLYRVNDAAPDVSGPVLDILYDDANPWDARAILSGTFDGTEHWFVSGASIYHGPAAGPMTLLSGETGMPGETAATRVNLKSVHWSADLGRLIFATGSGMFRATAEADLTGSTPGVIYARLPSGTWEKSAAISMAADPTKGGRANFTDTLAIGSASGDFLLCGIESSLKYGDGNTQETKAAAACGYGTYRPAADGSIAGIAAAGMEPTPIATWTSFSTTLATSAVLSFRLDADLAGGDMVLFALTQGKGLWSNIYDGQSSTWEGWFRE